MHGPGATIVDTERAMPCPPDAHQHADLADLIAVTSHTAEKSWFIAV
jgi:hypothetical protein